MFCKLVIPITLIVGACAVDPSEGPRDLNDQGDAASPSGDHPIAAVAAPIVVLWGDANYAGRSQSFTVPGVYDLAALSGPDGVGNDAVSSVQVSPGWRVALYEHSALGGRTQLLTAGTPFLTSFNDLTSSILIEPVDAAAVVVYSDANRAGVAQKLTTGRYDLPDLSVGNDAISSIDVPVGWRVTLYGDQNFSGEQHVLYDSASFLPYFNDATSSIVVEAPVPFNIIASDDNAETTYIVSGMEWHTITDPEAAVFGLDAAGALVANVTHVAPSDVALHSPTAIGDLYHTNGWEEVHTKLAAAGSAIVAQNWDARLYEQLSCDNRIGTTPLTCKGSLQRQVANQVQITYADSEQFTFGQSVTYKLIVPGSGEIGGTTSLQWSNTVGVTQTHSETVTYNAGSEGTITVPPGHWEKLVLSIRHGTLTQENRYRATLMGGVATNFAGGYNGHFFWWFDASSLISANRYPGNLAPPPVESYIDETNQIEIFGDATVTHIDASGAVLSAAAATRSAPAN